MVTLAQATAERKRCHAAGSRVRYAKWALGATAALSVELAVVLGLLLAVFAEVQRAHIAKISGLRAAVHALPDDRLVVIVRFADFLTIANALEQTSHAVDVFLRLGLF